MFYFCSAFYFALYTAFYPFSPLFLPFFSPLFLPFFLHPGIPWVMVNPDYEEIHARAALADPEYR
jgi:hypothetical protein